MRIFVLLCFVALVALPVFAFAQAAADYDVIVHGLDVSEIVEALIAAGALIATPGFTRWCCKQVARFFG